MPRAGVTPEKIFVAAEELVDRAGYGALSLGALAAEFGIKTPSLYKHIRNLEEIEEELALRGYRGLARSIAGAASSDGRERLREIGRRYRRFALEHPGLYAAAQPTHVNRSPRVQAAAGIVLERVFAVLREIGIPERDLVHAARSLRALVHGFVMLELVGGFGLPEDLEASFDYAIDGWLRGN